MYIIHPRTNYGSSSNTASKNYVSSATSYKAPKAAVPANTGSYGWNVNGQNAGIQKQTNTGLNAGKTQAGWNVEQGAQKQTNTGLNAGKTQAGWNVGQGAQKPSAPVGPPPAYPGLGHNPVASHNQPPAYSPSQNYPPAYSPNHNNPPPFGSATNTQYNQYYGQSPYKHQGSGYSNGGSNGGYGRSWG